ncbi:Elongation factor G [compost metagenome]
MGYNMEDLHVRFVGASLPPHFSHKRFNQQNNNTMKIVAEKCLREVFATCMESNKVALLEPIMSMDIQVDVQYLGSVMSDISGARRGRVKGISVMRGSHDEQVIHAEVPLSELIGYAKHLRSMTRGLGHYVMQFDRYEAMGREYQAKKLIEVRGY